MRTVSFVGPKEGESGAGVTEADKGVETAGGFAGEAGEGGGGGWKNCVEPTSWVAGFIVGCGSFEVPGGGLPSGSRTGNWIRTVSRDFIFGSGGVSAGGAGKTMRVVSFLGSFGAAIE
jgi:hypothetical protein